MSSDSDPPNTLPSDDKDVYLYLQSQILVNLKKWAKTLELPMKANSKKTAVVKTLFEYYHKKTPAEVEPLTPSSSSENNAAFQQQERNKA